MLTVRETQKESQFFARIKKNRVDPSNDSTGNPGMISFLYERSGHPKN